MITFGLLKHVHLRYIKVCLVPCLVCLLWWIIIKSGAPQIILHTITDYFGHGSLWHHNRSGYQKWFSHSFMWGSSLEEKLLKAPFVAVLVATIAPLSRAITTHCDVCVVVDWILTALPRVLSSYRLMRHWWTRPTRVFQQSVPLRSQWSTVFPHTNTFYGEFRAPCSVNICFPKWFCYWAPLPRIRAGSGLDHRLSTLLRSFLTCFSALAC